MDQQIQNVMQEGIFKLMIQGQMKACFEKCITRPGKELSSNEKQCLAMCQDRYSDAFQKTFFHQYQKLVQGMQEAQMEAQFPTN